MFSVGMAFVSFSQQEEGFILRNATAAHILSGFDAGLIVRRVLPADTPSGELFGQTVRLKRRWNVNAEAGLVTALGASIF
jgi:hypothetical protein